MEGWGVHECTLCCQRVRGLKKFQNHCEIPFASSSPSSQPRGPWSCEASCPSHHIKACGNGDIIPATIIGTPWWRVIGFTPRPFYPPGKEPPPIIWYRGLSRPNIRSGYCEEENDLYPCSRNRIAITRSSSPWQDHYIDWAVPARLEDIRVITNKQFPFLPSVKLSSWQSWRNLLPWPITVKCAMFGDVRVTRIRAITRVNVTTCFMEAEILQQHWELAVSSANAVTTSWWCGSNIEVMGRPA